MEDADLVNITGADVVELSDVLFLDVVVLHELGVVVSQVLVGPLELLVEFRKFLVPGGKVFPDDGDPAQLHEDVDDGEDQCNNYECDDKPNCARVELTPQVTSLIVQRVVVFEVVEEIRLLGKPPSVNVNNLHMLVAF